jgi:hypothetical protein
VAEWVAYQAIRGPLGPQREDFLYANLIRNLWAIAVPTLARDLRTGDYLLFEKRAEAPPRRQSNAAQMAIARGISQALAARGK